MPWSGIARRRPTWGLRSLRICPLTTSAIFRSDNSSTGRRMHSDTMEALERHRGHFYNWYDTQSLKPLQPTYISTVDSGNLAGHLLTLRPGLLALPDQKILGARWLDGLSDTLRILMDITGGGRGRSGPARSTSEGSGVRIRFPANDARGDAAVPRPAGGIRRESGGQPRCRSRELRERGEGVGTRPRPAMPGRPR